ncbi:MAG: CDP-diacylglycerol--serine O-phosphatidyltransferase [Bacteroidetes bacterium]|nr:CDP-diacylglycerol--serine O-phosphatidyltransferase [Bacteroidota bacterium]
MHLKRHIPNAITCFNLFFGCMAVVFALRGWLGFAVYMVITAAVFDFCDGLAARLLKAYSSVGKELDSLADLISFGLAPAAMMHHEFCRILSPKISYGLDSIPWELYSFFPFIIVIAAALRLAKFNTDERQSEHFIGIPTPASALLISSLLVYITRMPQWIPLWETVYTIPLLAVLLSWLMVSKIPMFSLKIKALQWSGNQFRFLFAALSLVCLVLALFWGWHWSLAVLLILSGYIVLSLLWAFVPPSHAAGDP